MMLGQGPNRVIRATRKIIKHQHFMAVIDQGTREIHANETHAAGDQMKTMK